MSEELSPRIVDDQFSPLHEHEPEVPPTFDDEGRCLVCKGLFEATEQGVKYGIRRALLDPLWLLRGDLNALEFAMADYMWKWGQHLPGVHEDTSAGAPTAFANMAMSVIRRNVQRIDPPRESDAQSGSQSRSGAVPSSTQSDEHPAGEANR